MLALNKIQTDFVRSIEPWNCSLYETLDNFCRFKQKDIRKHNNQILEQIIIPLINVTMASAGLLVHVVLYTSATVGISTFSSIKDDTPVSVNFFLLSFILLTVSG